MKLSIVVPAYNEQNYIRNCLGSILKERQNYLSEIEVIVVNNASTDSTEEIAASYPWVRIVREPNKGLVNARKAGYLASTGDLVANVDADTILPTGWIKKVFEEFAADQELVALSGPFVIYDQPLKINLMVRTFYYLGYIGYIFNRHIFRVGSMLQGGNYIFRRSAFEKIGGFSNEFDFYG